MEFKPITDSFACRLRSDRGLLLPTFREYVNPRMKEIAVRQKELMDEFNNLDKEIAVLGKLDGYVESVYIPE